MWKYNFNKTFNSGVILPNANFDDINAYNSYSRNSNVEFKIKQGDFAYTTGYFYSNTKYSAIPNNLQNEDIWIEVRKRKDGRIGYVHCTVVIPYPNLYASTGILRANKISKEKEMKKLIIIGASGLAIGAFIYIKNQ